MARRANQKPRQTTLNLKKDKRNPNSLRRLMRMIRQDIHHMTQAELAKHVNQFGNKYAGKQTTLTAQTIKNLETDRTTASYVHLERYAWSVGLPTGLLLIYSRLMSKQHNELLREITMLKSVITDISDKISRRTKFDANDELIRWSEVYKRHEARLNA